ncbi:DUF2599 domain-containing protein [Cellulomonas sp. HZM]|uniref:DUF2599 domain-containing protein n=1 Tax=Cellulomonas sp. HZM TaxID=1454010 RepID=UPI00068DFF50|nr:DUF2599 domain-containing protein [Cellulomonas sp. HZM]
MRRATSRERYRRAPVPVLVVVCFALTVIGTIAGCSGDDRVPGGPASLSSSSSSSSARATGTETETGPGTATTGPASPEHVRAAGTRIDAGPAHVTVLAAPGVTITTHRDDDGSVHARLTGAPTSGTTLGFLVGTDPATRATVLADGTALAGGGGLTPSSGRLTDAGDGVLALEATSPASVWFADRAVADAGWGTREGGRSLAVTPTAWARAGGLAAQRLVWQQLVDLEPSAESPSMHDQLLCHELGAPDKATWNLEPWRPEVDALEMLRTRCNPT